MKPITLKFGGSVLTDADALDGVRARIAAAARARSVYVVVSALKGSTDALIAIGQAEPGPARQGLDALVARHRKLADSLLGAAQARHFESETAPHIGYCWAVLAKRRRSGFERAALLSMGEKLSAALVCQLLQAEHRHCHWLCSERLIRTRGHALRARVDGDATRAGFAALLKDAPQRRITVITGFCGGDSKGRTTLLGRNASDYSAALVARGTDSERLEIIGDTAGILSADPDYVPGADTITGLSFADALLLSHAGSGVLHPRTLEPLSGSAVSVVLTDIHGLGQTRIGADDTHRAQSFIATWTPPADPALSKTPPLPPALKRWQQRCPQASVVSVFLAEHLDSEVCRRRLETLAHQAGIAVLQHRLFRPAKLLSLAVARADLERFTRLVHSALHPSHRETAVAIIGANGNIGRKTLALLLAEAGKRRPDSGARLRLVAIGNSSRILWCKRRESDADDLLRRLSEQPAQAAAAERLLVELSGLCYDRLVVVDASASAEVAALYERFLGGGIAIVTPNKLANSAGFERFAALRQLSQRKAAPYLYETTVGAALPVLKPLLDLRRAGDTPTRIEAVLSGTIAYVLDCIQQDIPFSQAVAEAVALGYAEPDPLIDLSGEDVARKILILLRTCGIDAERAQIDLQPLQSGDTDGRVPAEADALWQARVRQARQAGRRLCYIAAFESGAVSVGLREVTADSAFFRLRGTENAVVYRSELYRDTPLTITGPGAGIGVTSTGLFTDIISAAESLNRRAGISALAA